ncbi:MAG: Cps2D [Clostridium butyricum DORA_1]|nr:MAG: Cps2D [Clostridium butyricum DORA_1]MDU1509756.1 glycosyltransferase [Clostridium butyricum]
MGKIKSMYKFVVNPIKNYCKDGNFRREARYARYIEKNKIDDKMIMYESFQGKGLLCNPYAMFQYIVNEPEFKDYKHVWVLKELDSSIINKYKSMKNVTFVKIYTREYFKILSKAKYLINNVTFHTCFQKKEGQVYINTWHGTPLKHLGNDENTNSMDAAKNMIRNMICSDYIISQNKFNTNAMKSAFILNDIYRGEFIEEGYPRTDTILNTDINYIKNKLEEIGIKINKKVILYAPTWRGKVGKVTNNTSKLLEDIKILKQQVGEEYEILLKVHQLEYKYIESISKDEGIYSIPVEWDANELLSITDILITDYSSIYFDFLVTGKPILFYMYDKKEYIDTRGTYIDVIQENMPGPISYNINDLVKDIKDIKGVNIKYKKQYDDSVKKYCSNQNGEVAKRIVNYIFKKEGTVLSSTCYNRDKKHILIYGGGFLNNGITTSLLNIVNRIDYDKYTVSIVEADKNDLRRENLKKLNPNAKIFFRSGRMNCRMWEAYANKWVMRIGIDNKLSKHIFPKNLYYRESKRLLGELNFDIMIDFNGYVPFWDFIFLNSNSNAKKYIYQHNDMFQEYEKKINNKYKHRYNLDVIFKLYNKFDKVLSVSSNTMYLNKTNLSKFTECDNFTYTNNIVDVDYINDKLANIETLSLHDSQYIIEKENLLDKKVQLTLLPILDKQYINFVTVGRLSPEKDHDKLIEAFNILHNEYKNIRLYIIGDGVLKNELNNKIKQLELEDSIYMIGQISNPFYYMKNSDCFVLSSNHEGQPMVLLEALTLGQKIVATDIIANRGVLEHNLGELVENNIDGLVEGMEKVIKKQVRNYSFDIYKYNKDAFELFEERILK